MFKRFLMAFAAAFTLAATFSAPAQAADSRSLVLKQEFNKFYNYVQTLRPDGKVGNFMKYKKVGDFLVLWDLGKTPDDYDVIRLYNEHKDGTDSFVVSYYRSNQLVDGRTVIRRFVGPGIIGWRNDTVDAVTGEYLGMQGLRDPYMTEGDHKLVQHFKVRLFK